MDIVNRINLKMASLSNLDQQYDLSQIPEMIRSKIVANKEKLLKIVDLITSYSINPNQKSKKMLFVLEKTFDKIYQEHNDLIINNCPLKKTKTLLKDFQILNDLNTVPKQLIEWSKLKDDFWKDKKLIFLEQNINQGQILQNNYQVVRKLGNYYGIAKPNPKNSSFFINLINNFQFYSKKTIL